MLDHVAPSSLRVRDDELRRAKRKALREQTRAMEGRGLGGSKADRTGDGREGSMNVVDPVDRREWAVAPVDHDVPAPSRPPSRPQQPRRSEERRAK